MSAKADKIAAFDPNAAADCDSLFGLPFTAEESELVVVNVPWDVTTSSGAGAALGPKAVLAASQQVDLYDPHYPNGWQAGIAGVDLQGSWEQQNASLRNSSDAATINRVSAELHGAVEAEATRWLDEGKLVAVLGGDHSTPYGLIKALASRHPGMGILQIDAHLDLRPAYEGLTHSHASIMHNALALEGVDKLVSVGIRDWCHQEQERVDHDLDHISVFFDHQLKAHQFKGAYWADQVREIVGSLPQQVYVSFDIDGLNPELCPNTGTPVPGGLRFEEAEYMLREVAASGRTIVGFDVCEVAPASSEITAQSWDGNVGARLLYTLGLAALASQY